MNLAKKYYVDDNGNMIRSTNCCYGNKTEKNPEQFYSKLKLVNIGWLNNGVYFVLTDENQKIYYMTDTMFKKYINSNDIVLEGDWNFYQQGTVYSIGL